MHWGDITLPTIVHPAGAFGGLTRTLPEALKLPASSAVVGRVMFCGCAAMRIFFHSWPAKKNSLPRTMGPPTDHPKSLKRRGGLSTLPPVPGAAFYLDEAKVASKMLLRKYSNALPWKVLVPDLVTALTMAPGLLGYSAE